MRAATKMDLNHLACITWERLYDAVYFKSWSNVVTIARDLTHQLKDLNKPDGVWIIGSIHFDGAPDEVQSALREFHDALLAARARTPSRGSSRYTRRR
jgi:hypothetical protein